MQTKHLVGFLLVAAIVGGTAFYGGTIYAKRGSSGVPSDRGGNFRGAGGPGGQGRAAGGFTGGEVISKDAASFTVKTMDGGSKIIFYSTSTNVNKMVSGSMDDVAQGTEVTVMGTPNQDGSVAATTVQIRPKPVAPPMVKTDASAHQLEVMGNNFKFEPSALTVKKGEKVQIHFKNSEGFHDFKIDAFNVASAKLNGGQDASVEFTADKTGTFEYYCSVGSHRAMGMKGTLTVTE